MPRILRAFFRLLAAAFYVPVLVHAAVGYTPGSFTVSDSGAATYSIPIAVPPGAAGMQPSLSLTYNSQGGNGLLGMGWSLSGLSAITRCPQTYATDGNAGGVDLTYNDRYCLDGQRLILVAGTYGYANSEYRTERDTLTKIVAYGLAGNGPSYFIAQTKSGQTIQYGNSTDSRILATGKTTAMVWNANRITDTVGNYLTLTYTQNTTTGEYYPQRIDYAGNSTQGTSPSSSVQFVYATRTDTFTGYVAGSMITNTQRMTNIQVFEGATSIRDYRLTYDSNQANTMTQRSRLTALTECDSNISTTNCLPATSFGWSAELTGFDATPISTGIYTDAKYTQFIDVNGDGKTDIAYCVSSGGTWQIAAGAGSALFSAPVNTGVPCGSYQSAYPIDYNSDGKMDLVVAGPIGGAYSLQNWYVLLSSGTGFVVVDTGQSDLAVVGNLQSMDLNGDGRFDLVWYKDYSPCAYSPDRHQWVVTLNGPSGFGSSQTVPPGICDNKPVYRAYTNPSTGRAQLLEEGSPNDWGSVNWLQIFYGSAGVSSVDTGITKRGDKNPQIIDLTGDGRPDLVYVDKDAWYFRVNTGEGVAGFSATETSLSFVTSSMTRSAYENVQVLDYNGDGKMDLIVPGPLNAAYALAHWYIFQFAGSNVIVVDTGLSDVGFATSYTKVVDLNGNGHASLMYYNNGWQTVSPRGLNLVPPDQLTTITNGLGATTTITYKPLTNSAGTVYTKGTGAIFPQQDFQGPVYVVSQYTTSDGVGGSYPVSYSYQGARVNVQGRGFAGFSQITMTDSRTGIVTKTMYADTTNVSNWPLFGLATNITKTYGTSTISSQANTLSYYRYGAANAYYYFPYVSRSVVTNYELPTSGGSYVVSTVTTGNTYHSSCATSDAYCDLATIIVTTTAGSNTFTKTTNNTYDYSGIASWVLGRLTNAQVTSTLPNGSSLTRESAFTYYTGSGLLWTEVVEPNGNTGSITNMKQTTTYSYDGFGNKTGATVSGADGVSRPATAANNASTTGAPYAYTAGRFETNLTNAASQGESRVYDARFGTVSKLTGPNNLSTNWQYDNFGRKSTETRADGTTTTWAYSLCGTCPTNAKYYVTQTTSGAPTVTVYYDLLDRELRTQTVGYNGTLIYKDTIYNNLGQVAKVSRPYYSTDRAYWTYFQYDTLGRAINVQRDTTTSGVPALVTATTYAGLSTTVTAYPNGVVDGAAQNTTQVKDALGELVSVTDANNNTTSYQYDPFGNLTKVTDPALNVTTMTYDLRGRKLTMTDPDMGYWQYSYNSVGELIKQIDALGQTTTMDYDALGRLWHRWEPESLTPILYTYDNTALSGPAAKGKLSQISWPGNNTRTFVYDTLGRPITETTNLNGNALTMKTAYDNFSRVSTITYPSNYAVNNNYDPNGYLMSVTDAVVGYAWWSAPAYSADGQYTAYNLGNGLTTVNKYNDGTGLLEGISTGVGLSGSATQFLTYQYDTLGNLKRRVDGNQANLTENFGYDNLNRMTTASVGTSINKTVNYDSLGNITSKSDVGTYTYDPLHKHAVKTAGAGTYTYDANGNQKTGPNGRVITYNSFNQPTSLIQNGKTYTYAYDPDHLRTVETAPDGLTLFMHPRMDTGARFEWTRLNSGVVELRHFIYAGKEAIALYTTRSNNLNDLRYFHKDHLGSIDTITNDTGQVVERLSYDAWGKRRNGNWTDATTAITSLTRHGFTGHEHLDDIGLINMNGRIYDPTLGRFIQADPTVQSPGNPQTLNRYSYAGNNPLTYTDPSGYGFFSSLWNAIKSIVKIAVVIIAAYYTFQFTFGFLNGLWIPGGAVTAGVVAGAAGGFVGGFLGSGGNLQAGLNGALTGAIFGGIGAYGDLAGWQEGGFNRVLAHAAGGGISSRLQGEKFGPSALAAGFTQTFAPDITRTFKADGLTGITERTVAAAVVGGTASVLGGGKFENGARTAAFSRLFNDEGGTRKIKDAIDSLWDSTKENLKFGSSLSAAYGPGASVGSSYNLNGDTELDVTYSTGVMVEAGYHIGGTVYSSGSIQGAYQGLKACAIGCIDVKWNYQGGWSLGTSLEFPVALGARVTSGYTTSGRDVVDRLRR